MIEDPPYLIRQRKIARRRLHVDFIGLVLVATFFGPLQIMLDRGEEANWFASHFILTLAIVWMVSLATLVIWEWNNPRPVVNLRLFRNRTFGISMLLMFVLGFVLYGSIVLLPQYVQVLLGWSAERAGMVLSPAGFTLMLLMPVVGALIARFDARWLIALGFAICAAALCHMTIIDPQIDYFHAMMLRVYMAAGVALLFVPINTMAYTDAADDHNDDVSSMINLARSIGGSVGIAVSSAVMSERTQFHQARLVAHATAFDGSLRNFVTQLTIQLQHRGLSASQALSQSYVRLYQAVYAQAATLGYIDAFYLMALLSACMIPLCTLMKRNDPEHGIVIGY
jgi:DHA2 family multidrug resistance protein